MPPKQKSCSWRGPCPFRNISRKYLWHLLARGIGQRHFRRLVWRTDVALTVTVLLHFAINMLTMLRKCQFINAGLISIRKSRSFSSAVIIACLFLNFIVCVRSAPASPGSYDNDGINCIETFCSAGYEPVPCTVDGETDQCRQCPADKYQEEDNIRSSLKLQCYTVKDMCMPDTQHLVQIGEVSPANPPVCRCDTTRDFYQHGSEPDDCRKKRCATTEQLLLNGSCDCMEGRTRNNDGQCVWNLDVTVKPDLSTESLSTVSPFIEGQEKFSDTSTSKTTSQILLLSEASTSTSSTTSSAVTTDKDQVWHGSHQRTDIIVSGSVIGGGLVLGLLIRSIYAFVKKRSSQRYSTVCLQSDSENQGKNITVASKNTFIMMGKNNIYTGNNEETETQPSA